MLKFGILNITPDSFSDGGKYSSLERALAQFDKCIESGCDFVDIGGASSRPGSDSVSSKEEWSRVGPILETLSNQNKTKFVSVDTFDLDVIEKSLKLGVAYINSIKGLLSSDLMQKIKESACGFIAMHMKGRPKDMQASPLDAAQAVDEVSLFLNCLLYTSDAADE